MLDYQMKKIREWVTSPTPESARNLIRLYSESEWRSIRLEVVRSLGHFSDQRSLPFLVDLIRKNKDLAEQELALLSLARQKSRGAKLFLISFYQEAPSTLKPTAAYALGLSQAFEAGDLLLKDLALAQKKQDPALLKNCILALGELKEYRALPFIHEMLLDGSKVDRDLELALLFAMGRLERIPENVMRYEARYLDESILWQVYQATLSQVMIRSQFKLEDYLSKIFESDRPHSLLPFELRGFLWKDVEEGLSIFPKETYSKRHLLCLRAFPKGQASTYLESLKPSGSDWGSFFSDLSDAGEVTRDLKTAQFFLALAGGESIALELRLSWMDAFLPIVDFDQEAICFLKLTEERLSTRFLNLWAERALSESPSVLRKQIKGFLKIGPGAAAFSRLVRACVELSIDDKSIEAEWAERFKNPLNRVALLMYAERFSFLPAKEMVLGLNEEDRKKFRLRILSYLEAIGETADPAIGLSIQGFLKESFDAGVDFKVPVLKVLRSVPVPTLEFMVQEGIQSTVDAVKLQAIVAGRGYPKSRDLSEALALMLQSPSEVLRGRALDSILAHTTLVAKRAVMEFLKLHLADEFVVDKIYRDFDPEKKGGEEFSLSLASILKANPDHPQWEKLISLHERLKGQGKAAGADLSVEESAEVTSLDERLLKAIPKFKALDLATKLALRAAEQPFFQTEGTANLPIDKAPTVLEFCKALDLILEKHLGQKLLFPKLDRELHDFQTLWHRVGFGDDYPDGGRVLQLLSLKGKITPELFPLHKAKMMCAAFFNGKILQDRFKIFDGLRAWAVIFLVFSRKFEINGVSHGPLLKLNGVSDERCVLISKRLMQLQDLRNPAAHRQTYSELESVKVVRQEAIELINLILDGVPIPSA